MAPHVKINPPAQLPATGITDTKLKIWYDQLVCYLDQEECNALFLDGGIYSTWTAAEENPHRIPALDAADNGGVLATRRKQLRTFLTIVARSCHDNDYEPVVQHSTSLKWIVDKLREDNDIQRKGIHFLNLLDLQYDATAATPTSFYNEVRAHFINNLRKQGDIVQWKSATALAADEKISPLLEDMILYHALNLIDPRILPHVREVYALQMGKEKTLRDLKTEILVNIPSMLNDINTKEAAANMIKVAGATNSTEDLAATFAAFNFRGNGNRQRGGFRGRQNRGNFRFNQPQNFRFNQPPPAANQAKKFCRLCQKCNMPASIVFSHNFGDRGCTNISATDQTNLKNTYQNRFGAIETEMEGDDDIDEIQKINAVAKEFGYDQDEETS